METKCKKTCGYCKYYVSDGLSVAEGDCKRYPPQNVLNDHARAYPCVSFHDWCGEYAVSTVATLVQETPIVATNTLPFTPYQETSKREQTILDAMAEGLNWADDHCMSASMTAGTRINNYLWGHDMNMEFIRVNTASGKKWLWRAK